MKILCALMICLFALSACSSRGSGQMRKHNASERKVMRTHAVDAPPPMIQTNTIQP